MATLSHDMIIEILGCLSVKDLLRFKCVSKLWCSWIEDPYFINLHLSYSLKTNTNHSLILRHSKFQFLSVNYDSPKTTRRLEQPFGEQKKPIQIMGSCNGLLAVEYDYNRIFLWNLSTRKYQVLPSTKIDFSSPSICYGRSIYYGFGYDLVSDDYKLVRMVQLLGENDEYFHSEAKVYSLRSNCWRRIKDFCFHLIFYRELGFLANNVLHWMVSRTPESSNRNLVGFDLRSEEFRVVELPDFCLDENFYFDVKAMGGVKESWVKLMSSTQPDLLPGSPFEVPLAFSKNGNKVLFHNKYSRGNRDSLVWYDLGSKRVEKVAIEGVPVVYYVYLYVESLVPLNDRRPRDIKMSSGDTDHTSSRIDETEKLIMN
ncbi:hypothetical protein V6Z11_D08G021900 [Gossypium hirsutum]